MTRPSGPGWRPRPPRVRRSSAGWAAGATCAWCETFSPETAAYTGRVIEDIAAAEGAGAFDVLCAIVVADRFRTVLQFDRPAATAADWAARVQVWKTEGALVGGSDAGAHIERLGTFNYATTLLEHAVREHGLLGLEEAVHP